MACLRGYWWCSYRGYGLSEGSPTEAGLKQDTQAALDYLLTRKDVDPKKVLLSSTPCHGQQLELTHRKAETTEP